MPLSRTLAFALSLLVSASAFAAADVVTVGTVNATGTTVDVPVYIRDVAGTPLGVDQPAGSHIQSFSIKVSYAPASAVASVTFTRAGITANLTPTSEFAPATSGSISLLETFKESTTPIPFTLNAPPPGDRVAHLLFTLSSSATPGTTIALTLDPSLTQLTDEGGTAATKETAANGTLSLVNGAINIPQPTISLTPSFLTVRVDNFGVITANLSAATTSPTTVTLTSSAPNIASVQQAIVIPAGAQSADIGVTPKAAGTTDITASITGSSATARVNVVAAPPPNPCPTPSAPQVNAPTSADAGAAYSVSWSAVTAATEYVVEESTDENFSASQTQTQTVTGTAATFSHAGAARYYYRVRARNHGGTCDVTSPASSVVSVVVSLAPLPPTRVLPVVGSAPGAFGAYFKTSVQLYNPKTTPISGRIVFHTQGASGTSNDPSLAFALGAGKTLTYSDLLPALGVASGVGSADIVADVNSALPISLVRVFNDAGANGTTGLAEEALDPADALQAGSSAVLVGPADVQRFRMNVGIRTLERGATLRITVRDKDGNTVKTLTKSYDPTFFTQPGSAALLDGYALTGGETLTFDVTSGSAFVYGSTTDNTTNDPSVQLAQRIE